MRHQGPRRVRQGLLEPVCDGLANTIFQGRAVHILVETPVLDDYSSMQKVFGHPTSLYEVVFSMTNVLVMTAFSRQKITLTMVFVHRK